VVTILLTILLFPSPDEFLNAFGPITKKQSFELLLNRPTPKMAQLSLDYKRKVDGHTISLEMGKSGSQKEIDDLVNGFRSGSAGINPERSPSGIQLGDHCFVFDAAAEIIAVADGFYVIMSDGAGVRNGNSVRDARAIEALSRVALAEMIGSTLSESGTPSESDFHTNQHTHRTYSPLTTITNQSKTKPEIGEWMDRCTVKLGNHKLEFALASDMVTIDGKSTVIEAFVVRRKGVWMIPTRVLKQKGISLGDP
jgi:hypothetical protein